jgi:cell division transport system permease protein
MALNGGYMARETAANLRRNMLMTMAAILTVAVSLSLLAGALLLRQGVNKAAVQWRGGVELSIFMQPAATPEQVDAIRVQLGGLPGVKHFRFVDKPGAYAEFRTMFANTPDLLNTVGVDDMPPSFRVVPTRAEEVQTIGDRFKAQPGVQNGGVVYAKDVINSVLKDFHTKRNLAIALAVVVLVGAIALIVNTIQLAIFARRREVAVMKLVGATNWFIRVPFMLEGLIDGVIGAGLAFAMSYVARNTITSFVASNPLLARGNGLYVTSSEAFYTGVAILIVGALVGSLGSGVAVRRFLAV